MEELSEDALVRFQQGDLDAFETLFRLHQRKVYGWALRLVRNPSAADEITVECFWHLYRAHARFDPSRSFEGWARRTATRVAIDWMRTENRKRAESLIVPEAVAANPTVDPAVSAEIRNAVEAALNQLPPKLKVAAVLTLVEELPRKEAAEELGISVTAMKLRVHRAMRLMRSELAKRGIEP